MQKNRNAVLMAVQEGRLDCLKEMQSTVSPDALSQSYKQQSKVWKTCILLHCTCTVHLTTTAYMCMYMQLYMYIAPVIPTVHVPYQEVTVVTS